MKKDFGVGAKDLFWKVARVSNLAQFHEHMNALTDLKPRAAAYIKDIGLELFSSIHFPGRRYTHDTSNIVECMNSIYLEEREQPVLMMLNGIWHKEMDRHYQRYEKAQSWLQPGGFLLTGFGIEKLKEGLKFARQYTVQISSPDDALVTRATNGARGYTVNLEARKCTCHHFFDTDIPCVHAIAVIYRLQKAPIDYMPSYCRAETYRESYRINLPVINIEHLSLSQVAAHDFPASSRLETLPEDSQANLPCLGDLDIDSLYGTTEMGLAGESEESGRGSNLVLQPPLTRVPRGRPAKKRRRVGDRTSGTPTVSGEPASRAPLRCSTCHQVGH